LLDTTFSPLFGLLERIHDDDVIDRTGNDGLAGVSQTLAHEINVRLHDGLVLISLPNTTDGLSIVVPILPSPFRFKKKSPLSLPFKKKNLLSLITAPSQ
jgi:hypothetical protein